LAGSTLAEIGVADISSKSAVGWLDRPMAWT